VREGLEAAGPCALTASDFCWGCISVLPGCGRDRLVDELADGEKHTW